MSRFRIAVVEDEPVIRQAIVDMLTVSGYEVVAAEDGERGIKVALGPDIDLVLLDLMLPRRDGFSVLAELRQVKPGLPVIILTAKGSEEDVVRGLKEGADDYVVKPFGARELMARIEAVIRRSPGREEQPERLKLGDREVDFGRSVVVFPSGRTETLSETECRILSHLAARPGRTVSREELLARLWGHGSRRAETRTVDMHIARLRTKLGDERSRASTIVTVRGKGYRLAIEWDD